MLNICPQMIVGGVEPIPADVLAIYRPAISELGTESPLLKELTAQIEGGALYEDLQETARRYRTAGRTFDSITDLEAEHPGLAALATALDQGLGAVAAQNAVGETKPAAIVRLHDLVLRDFLLNEDPDLVRAANRLLKAAALVVVATRQTKRSRKAEGTDTVEINGEFAKRFWSSAGVRIPIDLPKARTASWPNGDPPASPDAHLPAPSDTIAKPGADADRTKARSLQAASREVMVSPWDRLTVETQAVLSDLGEGSERFAPLSAITRIDLALEAIKGRLDDRPLRPWTGTALIGTLLIEVDERVFAAPGCDPKELPCYCSLLENLTYKHWGNSQVHVLGMGQTFKVSQKFVQYQKGELVHTEPVLAGSHKTTSFDEVNETEETNDTFTSEEREDERSARSQNEFELSTEIEREAKKERETEIGASLSASYGSVSVSATAGATSATATAEAAREARRSAQQVIESALSRLRTKSEQRRTLRTLNRTQRNSAFEVTNNGASLTGFYHSINKEYEHQMMLVGRRLVFRVSVQRPLAFLLHCLATRSEEGVVLSKPVAPDQYVMPLSGALRDADYITVDNYRAWAALYGAEVEAPPLPITVTHAIAVDYKPDKSRWAGAEAIEIPKGYKADTALINVLVADLVISGGPFGWFSNTISSSMEVHLGKNWMSFSQSTDPAVSRNLSGEEGFVRLTYRAQCWEHAVNVLVTCTATPATFAAWQLKTYTAIRDAYDRKKAAYDNQVQAAKINQGVRLRGRNPLRNKQLIEEELQKFVLGAVYPPFYYRGFDSMKFGRACHLADGTPAMPEIDFQDARGETPWITFFLQMLELRNMTYKFLPYAFGQRPDWMTLRRLEDPDPLFETAMSAGQVIIDVPVAPAMTAAFLHFINTGQIWLGGDMPSIGDPMFQNMAQMIMDAENLDEGEPIELPWTVVAPTNLVYVSDTPPPLL